jgi:co-chaperonin GroES (HSP10)
MSQSRDDESSAMQAKRERIIQPLGPRVLVRLEEDAERTPSGLFLPQGVQERHQVAHYAQVIEVARDALATEAIGENVSGVPLGVYVLFPKHAGLPVPWDDTLRLVNTAEIVAIVEEVDAQNLDPDAVDLDEVDEVDELDTLGSVTDDFDEEQH